MPPRKRKQQSRIARFRVTLDEVIPPIRRVLEIDADGTFWELHVAIQDAFGWLDYHLHVFEVPGPEERTMIEIGIPDPDGFDDRGPVLPGWETPISAYLVAPGDQVHYVYDFGDDWRHTVVLEALGPAQPGTRYPRCVDGMRAGPPEDCGGPAGYLDFLEAFVDPNHAQHDAMRAWAPRGFNSEVFDPKAVVFTDPKRRLKAMLEE